MKKLRIATWDEPLYLDHARLCQDRLGAGGVDVEIASLEGGRPNPASGKMESALRTGEADMTVELLGDLPVSQPEGLVIAGLSERFDPACWLLQPLALALDGPLFKLREGALVGVHSVLQQAQMASFRPDVRFGVVKKNLQDAIRDLQQGLFDALMANALEINYLKGGLSEFHIVKFNPVECIPPPGGGVFAYRACTGDMETRRLARQLHHPDVSSVTNIERKVLKLLGGRADLPLGVVCERDALGNFHLHAALADEAGNNLRRARISQSTHLELAENTVAALLG